MFTTARWWGQFWANLVADMVVALVVGIVLAQYLGIRSERQTRREPREKGLELILNELQANRKEVARVEQAWSGGEATMPYLQNGAWTLVSENQLLQGLDADLAEGVVKAYVALEHLEKASQIFQQWYGTTLGALDSADRREMLKKLASEALAGRARNTLQELDIGIQILGGQPAG